MLRQRLSVFISALSILTLVLAACAAPTPQTIVQTQVVTQMVAGTPVERVIEVTPTPKPAVAQDTLIVGTWQQPRGFLDYANGQAIRVEIELLYRPRWVIRADFQWTPNPDLVEGDLPTLENGGAVLNDVVVKAGEPIFNPETFVVETAAEDTPAQQLVVTGKIKSGLKWSDGEPLTAGDFVFAWQMNCMPDSGALDATYCPLGSIPGAVGVASHYEAPDDTTLVLTYVPNLVDPLYSIVVFGPEGTPIPEHQFAGLSAADILADERANGGENAVPLGYGPYQMTEWRKGDRIVFELNPHWAGELPTTQSIIYRFFSDSTALAAAVIAGDVDSTSGQVGLNVDQAPYMESTAKQGVVKYTTDPDAASFEMLYFNYFDPQDKTLQTPHPVLGEFAVRKAIAMALDRQQMVDVIFYGQSRVVEQPHLPQMVSYDPLLGRIEYNPEEAKRLLDEAGWVPGEDGIRVKNGVRASINYITTTGSPPRQRAAQIIQASLQEIGIEVALNFQPSSVVFSNDVLYSRNFEMIQFANTFSVVDPGSWWFGVANCTQIPLPENGYVGANYAGWCEKTASDASAHANFVTLDLDERKADWKTVLEKYFSAGDGTVETGGFPVIPLHTRPNYLATVPGVEGAALDPTDYFTWNGQKWSLKATAE
jgi:peptide/nickel transport system substrate-binding protein